MAAAQLKENMARVIRGINNALVRFIGAVLTVTLEAAGYIDINGKRIYVLSTAITANVTNTAAPAGSFGVTTHATGQNSIFRSDGSKWQALA